MTTARRQQICLSVTPYYHCVTRCVRRAYLCGFDKVSRKNCDHRRQWIEDRLILLAKVFCIDVAGFAVMSNHYHVILRVDQEKAAELSDDEVLERWLMLYRGTETVRRYRNGENLDALERKSVAASVSQYRDHLTNLSRFMGNLNEFVARRANREDDCKGVFWESRFRSQALLDEAALLKTMVYVDLNPVRAGKAKTPESSKHTSVFRRLKNIKCGLMPFVHAKSFTPKKPHRVCTLPVTFKQYLEVLDWAGRITQAGKRGVIDERTPSIITRLGYTAKTWGLTQTPQLSWRQKALGSKEKIQLYCEAIGQNWIWQSSSV